MSTRGVVREKEKPHHSSNRMAIDSCIHRHTCQNNVNFILLINHLYLNKTLPVESNLFVSIVTVFPVTLLVEQI